MFLLEAILVILQMESLQKPESGPKNHKAATHQHHAQ